MTTSRVLTKSQAGLIVICLCFLLMRAPVMYRQPGGQDEDQYAIPGLTILEGGIPRLPHVPARNQESVFFHADEALFSQPPLYFYYQALFYSALPPVYGTARIASAIAGVMSIWLVYRLTFKASGSTAAALWAAGLLSVSRWYYFSATFARPDILCAAFGFASILGVLEWSRTGGTRRLVLSGLCLGLGGLTHPFAIVSAVQVGVWVFVASRGWRKFANFGLVLCTALLVFCAWLPLILKYPDVFETQIRNQFGGAATESILTRLFLPASSLSYHARVMWQHAGAQQFLLALGGLVGVTWLAVRSRDQGARTICWLGWSSILLMSIAVGTHHQVIGYWVYPAGFMFAALGMGLEAAIGWLAGPATVPPGPSGHDASHSDGDSHIAEPTSVSNRSMRPALARTAVGLAAIALLAPGSGVRALVAHLQHWRDVNYDAPRFARVLISQLPADSVYAVDTQFALDFLAAGRRTLMANDLPQYMLIHEFDYDWLIASRHALDTGLPTRLNVQLHSQSGIAADRFACYAEVYRSTRIVDAQLQDQADATGGPAGYVSAVGVH
ncbi:MAG: glycosyltransferase family 39 protein [Planctomycetaceae bacterium]|nr:glycosyltransferase family 39 protein [Planctomycetaceae bacterium]